MAIVNNVEMEKRLEKRAQDCHYRQKAIKSCWKSMVLGGLGELAGATYLRRSLYVLMNHCKKFGIYVRSVSIFQLSKWTIMHFLVTAHALMVT